MVLNEASMLFHMFIHWCSKDQIVIDLAMKFQILGQLRAYPNEFIFAMNFNSHGGGINNNPHFVCNLNHSIYFPFFHFNFKNHLLIKKFEKTNQRVKTQTLISRIDMMKSSWPLYWSLPPNEWELEGKFGIPIIWKKTSKNLYNMEELFVKSKQDLKEILSFEGGVCVSWRWSVQLHHYDI